MKNVSALIFGYNKYSFEIAKNILHKYSNINIFKLKDNDKKIDEIENIENFSINNFDLSDKWDHLRDNFDLNKSVAFCTLEDDAENIFLTIVKPFL